MSTLYIEAEGYAPTVETEVPQRGADMRIVLDRPALLTGRVLDLAGSPVPGAVASTALAISNAGHIVGTVDFADGSHRGILRIPAPP